MHAYDSAHFLHSKKIFIFKLHLDMYVSMLECIHECMCLQRPKEVMGSAGARAGRSNIGCELSDVGAWELNPGLL